MTTHENRTQYGEPQNVDPQYGDPQAGGAQYGDLQYQDPQASGAQYGEREGAGAQYPAGTQYGDAQHAGAQHQVQPSDSGYSAPQYADAQNPGLQQNDSPYDDAPRGSDPSQQPPVGQPGMAQPSSEPGRPQPDSDDIELALFGETEMSGFRARWNDVQAGFVDDPKHCVQTADALVSEVVDQLTAGFSEARARMEAQWARGEDASTEDLRVALKRYREFFQRLLSV